MSAVKHEAYFEKYWAMGVGRSLHKLAEQIVAERGDVTVDGMRVTLERMSAQRHWQERILQRVQEEADAGRKRMQEQLVRVREEFVTAARTDLGRYLDAVIRAPAPTDDEGRPMLGADGKPLGPSPVFAVDAGTAGAIMRLIQTLAGDPLAERQEISGPNGTPMGFDFLGQFKELDRDKLRRAVEVLLDGRGDGDGDNDADAE